MHAHAALHGIDYETLRRAVRKAEALLAGEPVDPLERCRGEVLQLRHTVQVLRAALLYFAGELKAATT